MWLLLAHFYENLYQQGLPHLYNINFLIFANDFKLLIQNRNLIATFN